MYFSIFHGLIVCACASLRARFYACARAFLCLANLRKRNALAALSSHHPHVACAVALNASTHPNPPILSHKPQSPIKVLSDASLRDHDKAKLLSWIDRFSHACRRALSGPVGGGLSMLILQKGKSGLEHLKDVQMVSCVGAPPPGGEAPARGGATPGRSEMKV